MTLTPPLTDAAAPRPFFGRVEALRGMGALAVAAYHASGWPLHGISLSPHGYWDGVSMWQNQLGRFLQHLFAGHAALMMFFVISGLVLRNSLAYGPQDSTRAVGRFVIARIFRIYPIVIFSMLLIVLLHGWQVPANHANPAEPLTFPLFLANLLLVDVRMNPVLWALQVEVLMVPLILLLYFIERRRGPGILLIIALITTPLSFAGQWAVWPPLSHNFFAFVLGMTLPTFGRAWVARLSKRQARYAALLALALMLLPGPFLGFYSRWSAVFEAYGACILVAFAAYRADMPGRGLLDWKPSRLLGLTSGSYYVLHPMVLWLPFGLAQAIVPVSSSVNAPAVTGMAVIVFALLAITPIPIATFHLVEAPGMAIGRALARQVARAP